MILPSHSLLTSCWYLRHEIYNLLLLQNIWDSETINSNQSLARRTADSLPCIQSKITQKISYIPKKFIIICILLLSKMYSKHANTSVIKPAGLGQRNLKVFLKWTWNQESKAHTVWNWESWSLSYNFECHNKS